MIRSRLPLLALLALGAAGCFRPPADLEGRACSSDATCGAGYRCVQGGCHHTDAPTSAAATSSTGGHTGSTATGTSGTHASSTGTHGTSTGASTSTSGSSGTTGCGGLGAGCQQGADCCGGICNQHQCLAACVPRNSACDNNDACCSRNCGPDGRCHRPNTNGGSSGTVGTSGTTSGCGQPGAQCTGRGDCCSGACDFGFCLDTCGGDGFFCDRNDACCSGACLNGNCVSVGTSGTVGTVGTSGTTGGCGAQGSRCAGPADCCSASCNFNFCQNACAGQGFPCDNPSACCTGACINGQCGLGGTSGTTGTTGTCGVDGNPCNTPRDCCSGTCDPDGRCAPPGGCCNTCLNRFQGCQDFGNGTCACVPTTSGGTTGATTAGTSGTSGTTGGGCANAITLGSNSTVTGDTTNTANSYTADGSAMGCNQYGANGHDVLYRFVPTVGGTYTFTLSGAFDVALYITNYCPTQSVITSCLGGADPNGAGVPEVVSLSLAAGATYYVFADGFSNGDNGPYTLQVSGPGGGTSGTSGTSGGGLPICASCTAPGQCASNWCTQRPDGTGFCDSTVACQSDSQCAPFACNLGSGSCICQTGTTTGTSGTTGGTSGGTTGGGCGSAPGTQDFDCGVNHQACGDGTNCRQYFAQGGGWYYACGCTTADAQAGTPDSCALANDVPGGNGKTVCDTETSDCREPRDLEAVFHGGQTADSLCASGYVASDFGPLPDGGRNLLCVKPCASGADCTVTYTACDTRFPVTSTGPNGSVTAWPGSCYYNLCGPGSRPDGGGAAYYGPCNSADAGDGTCQPLDNGGTLIGLCLRNGGQPAWAPCSYSLATNVGTCGAGLLCVSYGQPADPCSPGQTSACYPTCNAASPDAGGPVTPDCPGGPTGPTACHTFGAADGGPVIAGLCY